MKILLINYRYFVSGGPETYMFKVKALLEKKGHEVIPFSVKSNNNVKTEYEKYFVEPIGGEDQTYFEDYKKTPKTVIQLLDRQFYSFTVKSKLERLIKETHPDVCYLLHHYNKLSPSVIDVCKKYNIPVIMRLSDFFLVCPNGLLIRNGKICEECLYNNLLPSIKHRCVKDSLPSSIIKVSAMYFHRLIGIYKKVDYIISPSRFTLGKIKPLMKNSNFVHIPTFIESNHKFNPILGNYALMVGRIEEEKGIIDAIQAISMTPFKLKIVGKSNTGYDKKIIEYLKVNNIENVELTGPMYGKKLETIYNKSRFVLIPARWYENMPNVALEAMSYSKPIIASNIGSLKEIVVDNHNGLLVEFGNIKMLESSIIKLFNNNNLCKRLGKAGYYDIKTKYTPEIHYKKLIGVFNDSKKIIQRAG